VQRDRLRRIVEHHHHALLRGDAGEGVGVILHQQIHHLAAAQRHGAGPQTRQGLQLREELLLFRGPSRGFERVARVLFPTAWKIAPVIGIVASAQADLVAVIDHRNAAGGQQKTEDEFQPVEGGIFSVQEARQVV
jgi:hypothetical protein